MAVPRNRLSNARRNSRRAHHAKKPQNLVKCRHCQSPKMPHRTCSACGTYEGLSVFE